MSRPDIDVLHKVILEFATSQLEKHGDFLPFGASITAEGQLAMASVETESSGPDELVNLLFQGLCARADAGEIRAAGYCVDAEVSLPSHPEGTCAVYICLEDGAPHSVKMSYPYGRTAEGGIRFQEAIPDEGEARIFVSPEPAT